MVGRDKISRDIVLHQCSLWWSNYNIEFDTRQSSSDFKLSMSITKEGVVYCNKRVIGNKDYSVEDWLTAFAHELGHLVWNKYYPHAYAKFPKLTDIDKFYRAIVEIKCDIFAKELMFKSGYVPSSRFLYYNKDLGKNDFNSGYFSCLDRLIYYNKGCLTGQDILCLFEKYLPFYYQSLVANNPSALAIFNDLVKKFC